MAFVVFNHTLTKSSSFSRLKYYVYILQLYVYMSYICKRHVDVYICTCIYFTFVGAMYMYLLHLYVYIFYIVSAMYICVTFVCVYVLHCKCRVYILQLCVYIGFTFVCVCMSFITKHHV